MRAAKQRAVDQVGGPVIAAAIGRTKQCVYKWPIVPAEHVLAVESLTGISRHELRPDVFGPAEAA